MKEGLPARVAEYLERLESDDPEALTAVLDRNGYYLYASPNHDRAVGYTADELETMNLAQVVDLPFHHAAWVLRTIVVLTSKPIPFSSRLVTKSGVRVRIAGTLAHMNVPEKGLYFITSARPVPKRR